MEIEHVDDVQRTTRAQVFVLATTRPDPDAVSDYGRQVLARRLLIRLDQCMQIKTHLHERPSRQRGLWTMVHLSGLGSSSHFFPFFFL